MNGLRVKVTRAFSAAGTVADLLASMCGLTETKLPKEMCPDGILLTSAMIRVIASGHEAARSSIAHLLLDTRSAAKAQN